MCRVDVATRLAKPRRRTDICEYPSAAVFAGLSRVQFSAPEGVTRNEPVEGSGLSFGFMRVCLIFARDHSHTPQGGNRRRSWPNKFGKVFRSHWPVEESGRGIPQSKTLREVP